MSKSRTIHEVPIKDIQVIENVRTSIKDAHLSELMESIKQHGLEQAIKVAETKSNKYVLIYGQRRLEACRKLGWNTIAAEVVAEPDMQDLLLRNVTENLQRKTNTPTELGRICVMLKTRYKMNLSEIASRLSVPSSTLKRAIDIYNYLPVKFRESITHNPGGKVKYGNVAASAAHMILGIQRTFKLNDAKTEQLFDIVRQDHLSISDLQVLGALMAEGYTPQEAKEMCHDYKPYRLSVIVKKSDVDNAAKKAQKRPLNYLTGVIYGEEEPVKKPAFIRSLIKTY